MEYEQENEQVDDYKIIESSSITSYEFDMGPVFPLVWLANQEFREKSYLRMRDQDLEYASCGNLFTQKDATHTAKDWNLNDVHNFLKLEDQNSLNIYCSLGFWQKPLEAEWRSFNNTKFVLPEFELIRENTDFKLIMRHWNDHDPESVFSKLENLHQDNLQIQAPRNIKPERITHCPTTEQWAQNFDDLKTAFANNKFKKIVLARKTSMQFSERVNPFWLLTQLDNQSYQFMIQSDVGNAFIGASPERLFKLERGKLYTEALAGTRPRGATKHEDKVLEDELFHSQKDRDEHQFVVDAIRSALTNYSEDVDCPGEPEIRKHKNVQHLETPITANNLNSTNIKSIVNDLHPTPAVGASPKEAIKNVSEYEPFKRGLYASPIGIMNKKNTEWIVAIRSALVQNHEVDLYAGVGVIAESDADLEWQELNHKMSMYTELFQ